jgi:hypothetical protein
MMVKIKNMFDEYRSLTKYHLDLINLERNQSDKILTYINFVHFDNFNKVNHNFCLQHRHNHHLLYYKDSKIYDINKNIMVEKIVENSVSHLSKDFDIDLNKYNKNKYYIYNALLVNAYKNNYIVLNTWREIKLMK